MFTVKIFTALVFLLSFYSSESARILGIFTVPSKSHTILLYELFSELSRDGHEVHCKS